MKWKAAKVSQSVFGNTVKAVKTEDGELVALVDADKAEEFAKMPQVITDITAERDELREKVAELESELKASRNAVICQRKKLDRQKFDIEEANAQLSGCNQDRLMYKEKVTSLEASKGALHDEFSGEDKCKAYVGRWGAKPEIVRGEDDEQD